MSFGESTNKFTANISGSVIDCNTFSPTSLKTFAELVLVSMAKVSQSCLLVAKEIS